MVQVPRRAGVSGPTLVRLLARLIDADIPASRQPLAERLSQWLSWTDAIALSAVLDGAAPAPAAPPRAFDAAEAREVQRVRESIARAIDDDTPFTAPPIRVSRAAATPAPAPAAAEPAYIIYRQRYQAIQQTMETSIAKLRARLRSLLATQTPAMARLAVVDAIMERSLSAHERRLLATIPGMLEGHFNRMRQAAEDATDAAGAASAPHSWVAAFRADMRSVLRAELDIRLQPIEGLLAALRAH